jgi:hypothetical protein
VRDIILYGFGRAFVDFRPQSRKIDTAIWNAAPAIFSRRNYEIHGTDVDLEFDWAPARAEVRRLVKVPTIEEYAASDGTTSYERGLEEFVRLPLAVRSVAPDALIASFVEHHLCEMYLVMNVASPGTFSVREIRLPRRISHTVHLSAEILETGWSYFRRARMASD